MFSNQIYQAIGWMLLAAGLSQHAFAGEDKSPTKSVADKGTSGKESAAQTQTSNLSDKGIQAVLITSTKKDTLINCSFGQVSTKSGSVVYVLDNGQELAIFNVHSEPDVVKVILADNSPIVVPVGKELLLTRTASAPFTEIQPRTSIVCGDPGELHVGNGVRGFTTDFVIASVIAALPPLRAKLQSNKPDDKKIATAVLKSASMQIRTPPPRRPDSTAPSPTVIQTEDIPNKITTLPSAPYIGNLVLYEDTERSVHTKYGDVICAADSVAYMFQTANSLAVFVLDEKKKGDVKIAVGEKSITVLPAQEVVVTTLPNATFKDVNPKLGILFRSSRQESSVGNNHVFKAEFMIEKAAQQINGIRKLGVSDDPEQRKMLRRILKNAAVLQPTAKKELEDKLRVATIRSGSPKANNPAILYGNLTVLENPNAKVIDLTLSGAGNSPAGEKDVHWLKETENDWVAHKSKTPSAGQAAAILNCSEDCLLKTELSIIYCKRGAILFVDNHEKYMTVCTLDSKALRDVMVRVTSGQSVRLPAGCALVLRRQAHDGHKPSPARLIAYRSWSEKKSAGDIDFFGADFSLSLAMHSIEPLRQMISSDNPKERAQARSILKNASILAHIDPGSSYQRP